MMQIIILNQIDSNTMTESQRHNAILALLAEQNLVSVTDLISRIGMSPATARRDLNKLNELGKLRKVRNGAERIEADAVAWLPLDLRNTPHLDEKHRIARQAAQLLQPGSSVVINCGSTAFLLGQYLCGRPVQIITNYFPLASYLISQGHPDLVIMGGQYNNSQSITISLDDDQCQQYAAHWMFTSGAGLTADGLYKSEVITALSEQKVMRSISKLAVLADSSKVGQGSGMLFARADDIDVLITSKGANAETLAQLRQKGVEVQEI